jgi:hypothetical protein
VTAVADKAFHAIQICLYPITNATILASPPWVEHVESLALVSTGRVMSKRNVMKAPSTFLPIVLALSALIAQRQNSAAVVGYANVVLLPGYNVICNPLNNANNGVTNVIQTADELIRVFRWNVPTQTFADPATYDPDLGGWDANFDLPPGNGFVVFTLSKRTNTFVGEFLQGSRSNFVAGGNNFSLLGSKIPLPGKLSSDLQYPGTDGENVYLFDNVGQSYSNAFTFFDGIGWLDPTMPSVTSEPMLSVGRAFFVQNPGAAKYWVQTFNVFALQQNRLLTASRRPTASASIRSMNVHGGTMTLDILNPKGAAYDVQFSINGINWKVVATDQHSTIWKGPYPGGSQGYYQLSQPRANGEPL